MEIELEKRLHDKVDFGDLVELTLKPGIDWCARHEQDSLVVSPREVGEDYQERSILRLCGYYGGMQNSRYKEGRAVSRQGFVPVMITYPGDEDITVCLDPTLHDPDAVDVIKCHGEGLVKVPLAAIDSYKILSKKGRGLRVVN